MIPADFTQVPAALRSQPHWLLWREEPAPNSSRLTKVPYQAAHPDRRASSTDPATWTSFTNVVETVAKLNGRSFGIGFAFQGSGIAGIDFDGCLDEGAIADWASTELELLNTYAEISPSGTGIKAFVVGSLPGPGRKLTFGEHHGIELYNAGRYFAVTGRRYGSCAEPEARDLTDLYRRVMIGRVGPIEYQVETVHGNPTYRHMYTDPGPPPLDVDAFCAGNGIRILRRKNGRDLTIWIIECPGSHGEYKKDDGKAWIGQTNKGLVAAGCFHKSCSLHHSQPRWAQLRAMFEQRSTQSVFTRAPSQALAKTGKSTAGVQKESRIDSTNRSNGTNSNGEEEFVEERMGGVINVPGEGIVLVEAVAEPATGALRFVASDQSQPFLKFNHKGILLDFTDKGIVIIPPFGLRSFIEDGALCLPSEATPVDGGSLDTEIPAFIERFASVPTEWLEPIAQYIKMTWVYDRFTALPYQRFLGESGSGKTRMLEICQALCYRAFLASGNITGPALFRSLDLIRGTFLLDEGDFKNSEEWSDIVKILNAGYIPGKPIVRCNAEKSFRPQSFYCYGPKIISTRNRFADNALERRCLTFETGGRKAERTVPLQLPPEFHQEALVLRNKLLGWRFDVFSNIQVDQTKLRDLESGLAQIGMSLLAVASTEQARQTLTAFLTSYDKEALADSPKGLLAAIIADLREQGVKEQTCKELAESMNARAKDWGLEPTFTGKRVGLLAKAIGYDKKRTNRGYVAQFEK